MKIKGWKNFQHFKDRRPPWIKLHRDILENRDINTISDKAFRVLVGLWLLASEDKQMEGNIPSIDDIAFRLRIEKKSIIRCLAELDNFVEQEDINMISTRCQVDVPETETETETEAEELPPLLKESKAFISTWDDWKKYRAEKKKPLTKMSIKKQIKALGKLTAEEAIKCIEYSIMNGYQGIFPDNVKQQENKPKDHRQIL